MPKYHQIIFLKVIEMEFALNISENLEKIINFHVKCGQNMKLWILELIQHSTANPFKPGLIEQLLDVSTLISKLSDYF